jgi:hypothetical protein
MSLPARGDIATRSWLMGLSRAVDTRIVRPRFGRVTQVLSVVFVVAGLGAAAVGVNSGHQTTPGSADNGLILITLGAAYLLVGAGLWMEYVWAWWIGLALTSIVVVVDLIRGTRDGGLVEWSVFLVLFALSFAQGLRDRATQG